MASKNGTSSCEHSANSSGLYTFYAHGDLDSDGTVSTFELAAGTDAAPRPDVTLAELAEVVFGGAHYTVLFYLGTLLFISTFVVNSAGDWIIARMKRRLGMSS